MGERRADSVNKWLKRALIFWLLFFCFCLDIAGASSLSPSQSCRLHCPPPSLSPKEIWSYSFTPSETCGFPLLFVREAPQSWVQPTFLGSFSLIPPCTAHTSYSALFTSTCCSGVISHLSEFTWAEASPRSILSPAPGRLLLSLRTRLGYRVCGTHPSPNDPSFLCVHGWVYAYKLHRTLITWFCNYLIGYSLNLRVGSSLLWPLQYAASRRQHGVVQRVFLNSREIWLWLKFWPPTCWVTLIILLYYCSFFSFPSFSLSQ